MKKNQGISTKRAGRREAWLLNSLQRWAAWTISAWLQNLGKILAIYWESIEKILGKYQGKFQENIKENIKENIGLAEREQFWQSIWCAHICWWWRMPITYGWCSGEKVFNGSDLVRQQWSQSNAASCFPDSIRGEPGDSGNNGKKTFCENKKKHVLSTRWLAATGWDRSQGQALNAGLPAADKPTFNDPSFYSSYSFSNSAYLQIYNIYLMHFMRVKILPIDPSTLSRTVKTVTVNFSISQQSLSTFLMRQSPQCQHVQCTILRWTNWELWSNFRSFYQISEIFTKFKNLKQKSIHCFLPKNIACWLILKFILSTGFGSTLLPPSEVSGFGDMKLAWNLIEI